MGSSATAVACMRKTWAQLGCTAPFWDDGDGWFAARSYNMLVTTMSRYTLLADDGLRRACYGDPARALPDTHPCISYANEPWKLMGAAAAATDCMLYTWSRVGCTTGAAGFGADWFAKNTYTTMV